MCVLAVFLIHFGLYFPMRNGPVHSVKGTPVRRDNPRPVITLLKYDLDAIREARAFVRRIRR